MTFEDFVKELRLSGNNTIKVDKRETIESDTMYNLVKKKADEYENREFEVKKTTLEVGDYAFKNIGIERKEQDYIRIDDVLTKAEELKRAYDHAFVFISTDLSMLNESHKERKQVTSLNGLTASLIAREVYPIFCSSRMDMVEVMLKTFDKMTDEKNRTIKNPIRPEPSIEDWEKHVVMSLPNVGRMRANSLLENFDTVQDIMNASKGDLQEVEGFGPKMAKDILKVVKDYDGLKDIEKKARRVLRNRGDQTTYQLEKELRESSQKISGNLKHSSIIKKKGTSRKGNGGKGNDAGRQKSILWTLDEKDGK